MISGMRTMPHLSLQDKDVIIFLKIMDDKAFTQKFLCSQDNIFKMSGNVSTLCDFFPKKY